MSKKHKGAKKTYSCGRIKRGPPPWAYNPIKEKQYRKCLPELKRDFDSRCAYCMRHLESDSVMDVDHFDPREKENAIQRYANLFLADRRCNRSKSDDWPDADENRHGIRFLNCCEEQDYNECIFEDPQTHELIGTTPAAIYHIETIDLNAPELIEQRKKRSEYLLEIRDIEQTSKQFNPPETQKIVNDVLEKLMPHMKEYIPFIKAPPVQETA